MSSPNKRFGMTYTVEDTKALPLQTFSPYPITATQFRPLGSILWKAAGGCEFVEKVNLGSTNSLQYRDLVSVGIGAQVELLYFLFQYGEKIPTLTVAPIHPQLLLSQVLNYLLSLYRATVWF